MTHNGTYHFAHVKALGVQPEKTSAYTLLDVDGYAKEDKDRADPRHPTLVGKHAGDQNKRLRAAISAANAKRVRGRARGEESDEERGLWGLELARSLWPMHVFTDWSHVYDDEGDLVPYSSAACEALMRALPDDLLAGVIRYFLNPRNFAGDDPRLVTPKEVEAYAGN